VAPLACRSERAGRIVAARRLKSEPPRGASLEGVSIAAVRPRTPAHQAGLVAEDRVLRIDGAPTRDFLDFYLGSFAGTHRLQVMRQGRRLRVVVVREPGEDLGVDVSMGRLRPCGNRCIFCFVDQLPQGLRRELYFKDEDYRLSFLHGNYLTLTNLADADRRRIEAEHLSPLYVSVHATDPGVRARLLGRRSCEPVLDVLRRLGGRGIRFHTQVVVVPGYNDGEVLGRTLNDLVTLGPSVLSVSVVPVGLTAHRRGLAELRPVRRAAAALIVDAVARLNQRLRSTTGRGVVYASDEMFILAGRPIPGADYYDDYPQIENGVGLVRQLLDQLPALRVSSSLRAKRILLVTGLLARPFIEELAVKLRESGVRAKVKTVANSLLGRSVTVSGLLPGKAIIATLKAARGWDAALLPPDVVNSDGVTLDDVSASDMARITARPVVIGRYDLRRTIKALQAALARE